MKNNIEQNIDLTILIPAYNEESSLKNVLLDLQLEISKINYVCEIIVVNDGSDDQTAEIAKSCNVRLINHPYNRSN